MFLPGSMSRAMSACLTVADRPSDRQTQTMESQPSAKVASKVFLNWQTLGAAAPSVGQFKKTFEDTFAEGCDSIVCVCLSEGLSATVKHADMARDMLPGKNILI